MADYAVSASFIVEGLQWLYNFISLSFVIFTGCFLVDNNKKGYLKDTAIFVFYFVIWTKNATTRGAHVVPISRIAVDKCFE